MRTAVKPMQIFKTGEIKRTIVLELLSAVCGFLLSRTVLFDSFMPFGVAFISSLSVYHIFAGLFGVIIGSIVPANGGFSAYYIGLAVLSCALKFVCLNIYEKKNSLFFSWLSCGVCNVFGFIALFLTVKLSHADYIRILGEALLSISATYFLACAMPLLNSTKPFSKMSSVRICSAIMSVSLILMSLNDFTVLSASPAKMFSVLIILLSARFGGLNTATICAVSLGFAMSITGGNEYYLVGAYAFGGMLSGIFGSSGKIPSILGFLMGSGCVLIGFFNQYDLSINYAEIIIGCLMFLTLPRSCNKVFLDIFSPPPQLARVDSMRKNLVMRLKFSSNALMEVSRTVDEIGKKLDKRESMSISQVFKEVQNKCCENCGLKIHCYETKKNETYNAFLEMTKAFKVYGKTASHIPDYFARRCLKPEEVSLVLYDKFEIYQSQIKAKKRIADIRGVISDQMDGMSDMLYDMALEFNEAERFDTETASRIDTLLRSLGISATDVCCKADRRRRLSVEITAKRQKQSIPKLELVNRLSSLCSVRFDTPCITNGTDVTLINLTEKTNYCVDTGVCQINCNNETLSGDSYTFFNDGKGNFVMILSDGMGSGPHAAVDSSFTANLMEKLIKAGFGFECALKLVNSAMIFKSSDESTATIDIAAIDLYSGQTDFYKAGAAETYVVKGKKVGVATCNAYPAGILNEISFDKTSTYLQKGNVVVMFSDGVCEENEQWIEDEILNNRKSTAQTIADKIASKAAAERQDGHSDDITVMVAVIGEEY
ncbi:MAG: SpoIIE family protein phosphatase [Acutalibacteraceae bacterium]|nr:SpoIIE family protein phosphatase [Acutalibacteraceae bacterium]